MKNKVLATLLAVCLFAGLAVPAFAGTSSQSGVDADIKTLEFVKDSYTVKNTETEDMAKQIRAYVSAKQLVQDPNVVWSIQNDDKYAFNISDAGLLSAVEDAGTATVIATINVNGKDFVAKTKVVAAKAPALIKATGFQFEDNKIAVKTGVGVSAILNDDGTVKTAQDFNIVAYPKDAKFTAEQLSAIETAFDTAAAAGEFDIKTSTVTVTPTASIGDNKVVVSYANGAVTPGTTSWAIPTQKASTTIGAGDSVSFDGVTVAYDATNNTIALLMAELAAKYTAASGKNFVVTESAGALTINQKPGVTVAIPNMTVGGNLVIGAETATNEHATGTASTLSILTTDITSKVAQLQVAFPRYDDNTKTSPVRRSVTISGKIAKSVNAINAAGTVTIEVGETAKVKNLFKQGPSSANVTFKQATPYENYVDQNTEFPDYAVLTGGDDYEIIGVAVGTNKISTSITLPTGEQKEASLVVKVVEKGTKPAAGGNTTVLSAWAPKLGVGETANIVVKADGDVTYKSLNEAVATVDAAGKITAVKEGVAKISVQEEGKDMVYLTVTVGATTTKPEDKPTDVPQTAVAALVALF